MKPFLAATILTLAATNSAIAQDRVQDYFHATTVIPCDEDPMFYHRLIEQNTNMRVLFRSITSVVLPTQDGSEHTEPARMIFYVDQNSGQFAITATFIDGVVCVLTEGDGFAPYVD